MPEKTNSIIDSFWDFIKHPINDVPPTSTFSENIKKFIPIFLLEILLTFGCTLILAVLGKLNLIASEDNKVVNFYNDGPVWIVLLMAVLFAPLIEELIFRYPLRLNEKKIHITFFIILFGLIFILLSVVKIRYFQISVLILGLIIIPVYFKNRENFNQHMITLWSRKYLYIFYTSVVTFGLLHSTNYELKFITFLLLPLLILPQLTLGVFCAYIRLRLGFFWGYTFHVSHNFIFIIPVLLYALISGANKNGVEIVEHKFFNKMNYSKITNDTIVFDRLKINDIIPKLLNIKKDFTGTTDYNIEYEDSTLADKILTVNYYRENKKSFGTIKSSSAIVLIELLRKFKLKIEKIDIEKDIYQLQIIDSIKLNNYNQFKTDTIKSRFPPIFYDEATLHNASLDLIAKTIALNYNKDVVAYSKNHNMITIKIPKIGFEDLNQYMTEQYGITLIKSIGKVPGYKIWTAD